MRNVPENLINFRVYEDGGAFLGISDITLPKLSAMTQTIKGAGLAGELEAPTRGHYGFCEVELNWRTIEKDLLHLAANTLRAKSRSCFAAARKELILVNST